jgi:hypothetical protein
VAVVNLKNVAAEMRTALLAVPNLRVPVWGDGGSIGAGGLAIVGWPDRVELTATYVRGKARVPDWPVFLLASGQDRGTHDRIAALIGDTAPGSANLALEAGAYTACDFVHVSYAEIDPAARYQGAPVIAAVLHVDVNGPGK